MANDGQIYITIFDKRGVGSSGGFVAGEGTGKISNQRENGNDGSSQIAEAIFITGIGMVESQIRQSIGFTMSNITAFANNYVAQKDLQILMNAARGLIGTGEFILNSTLSIGGSIAGTVVNVAMGNPVGAVISAIGAVASSFSTIGTVATKGAGFIASLYGDIFNNIRNNMIADYDRNQMMAMYGKYDGYEGLIDLSRTGGE